MLEVGNGISGASRHNALTVLKNGNVGIDTHTPDVKLQITNGEDASLAGGNGFMMLGDVTGLNVAIDNNEIMARNNGAAAPLYLQNDGGDVVTGGFVNLNRNVATGIALKVNGDEALWYNGTYFSWGFGGLANFFADNVGIGLSNPNVALDVSGSIEYTGSLTQVSDKRLKKNFKPIDSALSDILKVDTYTYNKIHDQPEKREYGVIAQELQKIFPDMVKTVDQEKGHLGVSYVQLVPVLIKALQEQQYLISEQESKIQELSSELTDLKIQNNNFDKRMTNLEKLINFKEQ